MFRCNRVFVKLVIRILLVGALGSVALAALPAKGYADVDKKFDWKNKKRNLKICLEPAGCPAGMADSVKAAINLWKKKLVSWKIEWSDNCDGADVKIKCGDIKGLGLWESSSGTYGASTGSTIAINNKANWGYCNDKLEIVSTIAHEIGHAMRLNDIKTGQDKLMRGKQGANGHLRGPTPADSTEASTADSTTVTNVDTAPTGGRRQSVYTGTITAAPGTGLLRLMGAISIDLTVFRSTALQNIVFTTVGDEAVEWTAEVTESADHVEAFFLTIQYPESTSVREGLLHITEPVWDPGWHPIAIAPPDTIVPTDTSMIVLDATHSFHPAGPESMIFRWMIDGPDQVIKGEPITSVTLPMGSHDIVLEAMDDFGNVNAAVMHVFVETATGADVPTPPTFGLGQNYPNPFNPYTIITYDLPVDCRVKLEIYNALGQRVATLVDRHQEAGTRAARWDGKDAAGRAVSSGVYFYRLQAGGFAETKKLVLLR
jgi:hypothetical protein